VLRFKPSEPFSNFCFVSCLWKTNTKKEKGLPHSLFLWREECAQIEQIFFHHEWQQSSCQARVYLATIPR
jgi:hypothetical protein